MVCLYREAWDKQLDRTKRHEKLVKDIKRATRKHYSSEKNIRVVLDCLRGKESIAELCQFEGISQGIYTNGPMAYLRLGNSCAQASAEQGRSEFYRARTPLYVLHRWH